MITCTFEDGGKGLLRHVVIDTIVLKDDQILLVKRAEKLLEGGKWGIVGGFVERDEKLKDAVAREVVEETGWSVKDITLLQIKDNPNRPHEDRQNISFSFFCQADKKVGEKDWESDEIKWFPLDSIPEDLAFDHGEDIKMYKKYLTEKFPLPISL